MGYEAIIYEKKDGIAILTFNRPEVRNAGNMTLYSEMGQAVADFEKDDESRVLIITGAGKAFHSGDDVKQIFLADRNEENRTARTVQQLKVTNRPLLIINTYKPTIAAVNGAAVGEGFAITLSCDIRIASENAKFGYFYVLRGIVGNPLSAMVLPQIVGLSNAYEMMLSGELIDATKALKIGLVTSVVPQDQLMAEATAMAKRLMKAAPLAQRAVKQCVLESLLNPTNYIEFNISKNRLLFQTDDHKEGARAFAEKREPNYKGR
jgi:enoyl-CoA hydratase/carnithine racemase